MRIEELFIDQFGVLSRSAAHGLSDRLNIILAHDEAGKHNALQFIDWMLLGSCDGAHRYSRILPSGASGTMTVVHNGIRSRISRRDDGTHNGYFTIDGHDRGATPSRAIASLIGTVTPTDFALVFSPPLSRDPNPEGLLEAARRANFDLVSHRVPSERLRSLQQRLDRYHADLERSPWSDAVLDALLDRRRATTHRIERLIEDHRRRRQQHEETYRDLSQQIERLESDVDRLRDEWQRHDDEAARRRRDLYEVWRVAEEAKNTFVSERRNELANLESRLDRGRGIVAEIRLREQQIDEDLELRNTTRSEKTDDSACLMASLVDQIDRLRREATAWYEAAGRNEHREYCAGSTTRTATALDELRREASRLCRELQCHREEARNRLLDEEMEQLGRCDTAMSCWLKKVEAQCDAVRAELREVEQLGLTLVDTGDVTGELEHPDGAVWRPLGHVRAVLHACDGEEACHPDADHVLRELIKRRDTAGHELDRLKWHLDQLLERRKETDMRMSQLDEHELAAARRELEELESRIRTAEKRDRLQRDIAAVQNEMRCLDGDIRPSTIVGFASDMLQVLTQGRYARMYVDERHTLHIEDARGDASSCSCSRLGRSDRRGVYLALSMALVEAYSQKGVELPLVLDDVFEGVNGACDDAWAEAITRFSDKHQVIIVTRYRHVIDLWPRRDYTLNELLPPPIERPLPPPRPEPIREPRSVSAPVAEPEPAPEDVDQVRFKRRTGVERDLTHGTQRNHAKTTSGNGAYAERDNSDSPVMNDERHSLSLTTPIDVAGVIDLELSHRLRREGVATVRDLLEMSTAEIEHALKEWEIDRVQIRQWQDELALRCWVVGLNADDAQLLVRCGVADVEQLAEYDTDDLYDQLAPYIASHNDAHNYRGELDYVRQRVVVWVKAARRSRTDWARFRKRSFGQRSWPDNRETAPSRATDGKSEPRPHSEIGDSRAATLPIESDSKHRFYLNGDDPLVDAPSIGPKTAERFHAIGVQTVSDFLSLDPDDAANRLDHRRLTAKTILEWQAQANLACRIPELRGHDAQILVACGITEPAELAGFDPQELWGRVRPLAKSSEGKRVIRGGKAPDLQELTHWIQCARNARTLRAA